MTGLLDDMLRERGEAAGTPHLDLDAVVRAGERRVRRTRVTTGLAAAAVAGAVAAGALVLPDLFPDAGSGVVAEPPSRFVERKAGYAQGTSIVWGDATFDVGVPVVSYVQTDDGFVYATRSGDVHLFDGADSQRIGFSANRSLRTDDSGSLVAWVDLADDKHPQYVVFDTAGRTEVARVDDNAAGASVGDDDGGAFVYAVDDGAAYWRTEAGIVRYDITGDDPVHVLSPVQRDPENSERLPRKVVDVAAGVIAYSVTTPGSTELRVGENIGDRARRMPMGWNGYLSPDGRLVGVEDSDRHAIYMTATGEDVTPQGLDRYPFAVFYGWSDSDTAMAFAIKDLEAEPYTFDVLTCDVPVGSCEVVSAGEVPRDRGESFVVPVGEPMT